MIATMRSNSMARKEFKVKLEAAGPGGAWTFLTVPFSVEKVFGTKARLAVKGTINGFTFRSSLFPAGNGSHTMMVNKSLQKGAKAGAGDTVKVALEPGTALRTVPVPADLKKVLTQTKEANAAFDKLPYSHRKEYVDWIEDAKKPETRARRVQKAVSRVIEAKRLKG